MSLKKKVTLAGLGMVLLTSAAFAQDLKVEVMTNWVSGGESAALNTIASAYEAKGGTWVDNAAAANQTAAITTRIVGGDPMGSAKFNTGTDLDELYNAGLLSDITSIAQEQNWETRIPSFVWDAIRRDGKVYAAPINSQSEVWLWYSKAVFAKAGITAEPATYDELFADLDKIRAAGFIPAAVPGQHNWLGFIFYKILAGVDSQAFLGLQGDNYEDALKSDGFKRAAEIFQRLKTYTDPGSTGREWNAAVNMVVSDQAGITIMGDWAKGEFSAAGKTAGTDYGCMLGPEQEGIILSGDAFIFPKNEAQQAGQQLLASVMLAQNTQVAFNKAKGSMPVILDADVSTMDECTQRAMKALQDPANRLPSLSYVVSADRREGMLTALETYWSDDSASVQSLIDAMTGVYQTTE